jgi:hypothetical protein
MAIGAALGDAVAVGHPKSVEAMRRKIRQLMFAAVVVALGAVYAGAFAGGIFR